MANMHYGNLADVFKHLALAEILGGLRPSEYWESHAGSAFYDETAETAVERQHGVHTFLQVAKDFEELRFSFYYRILSASLVPLAAAGGVPQAPRIPGSPTLARSLMSDALRRLLFCDTDADSLLSIRQPLPSSSTFKDVNLVKVECVQDDGVSVLRGAGMLLPEPWTGSTLAFIDPYDMDGPTDAGISPLELACELANRSIPTLLFYTFPDDAGRVRRHERLLQALEKTRLLKRGAQRFEGSLKITASPKPPTQWGFGLIAFNLRSEVLAAADQKLRALEAAYERTELPVAGGSAGGAWRYIHATL